MIDKVGDSACRSLGSVFCYSTVKTLSLIDRVKTLVCLVVCWGLTLSGLADEPLTVTFRVTGADGAVLPCRIHLRDDAGKAWHTKFERAAPWGHICDGMAQFDLPAGNYVYEIEKGPQWSVVSKRFSLQSTSPPADQPIQIVEQLKQQVDLVGEGWYGGDLHVHRPIAEIPLIMRAEDLRIASVQTWWNEQNLWEGKTLPPTPLSLVDSARMFHVFGGEDERGGGALLFHDMDRLIDITGSEREWPPSVRFQDQAAEAGAWVEIEKPFWWDTPIWLANGKVDSIGIAHNHLHRRGVLPNEAWGRPRDENRYPGALGNGLYTQELYYRILNCGFRIPPSASSASGVLANPVGYNRVYAHLESEFTWKTWWNRFRAGHVFVSNGPLLRLTANGQLPGTTLSFEKGGGLIRIKGRLDSRDPIESIELVQNGEITKLSLPGEIRVKESGWILVRAIASPKETFRFASTGPWYVEIGDRTARPRREDAAFFLQWVRERRERVAEAMKGDARLNQSLAPIDKALSFWQEKLGSSKAN